MLLWEEKVVINSQWPDCKRYIQKTALPSKNLTPTLLKLDTKLSVIRSCEEVIASSHRNGFSAWKTLHGLQPAKDSNKVHLHLRLQGQHFSFENILLWSKYWSILGFTILLQPLRPWDGITTTVATHLKNTRYKQMLKLVTGHGHEANKQSYRVTQNECQKWNFFHGRSFFGVF